MIVDQLVELIPTVDLVEHPDNPRRGNDADVEESIRQHGFYGVILRQKSTGYVVVGNTRLRAARNVGLTELPVETRDMTDAVAKRIMLRDNRSSELGTFDATALVNLLSELAFETEGLLGTGYGDADMDDLLKASGLTGDAAAAFLDPTATDTGEIPAEIDNRVTPTSVDDRPADTLQFQVTYTVTDVERASIFAALKAAKIILGPTATNAEALAYICTQYVRD